jgi:endonuclease V-like protein UPF0215 family
MKTNKEHENRREKFNEICEQLAFDIKNQKKRNSQMHNKTKTTGAKKNNEITKKLVEESKLPEAIKISNWFQQGWSHKPKQGTMPCL